MSKEDVKFYLRRGSPTVSILRFSGEDMHSQRYGDVFKYCNCDEKKVKDGAIYKVWCLANRPREAFDYGKYVVLHFKKVPRRIIKMEERIELYTKRIREYWRSMGFGDG